MRRCAFLVGTLFFVFLAGGCRQKPAEAAPAAPVVALHPDEIEVGNAAAFPLARVVRREQPMELQANAVVAADVGRTVQVISQVPGKLIETRVQLGDTVSAGQVLAVVRSADLQQAYSDVQTAQADEQLARSQLARSQDLAAHGAAAAQEVEVARNAADDAGTRLHGAQQKLRAWGIDPMAPAGAQSEDELNVTAPRSGVVIAQNMASGTLVPTPDNSTSLFTIADLSRVWVLCDVYENQLAQVSLGDHATIEMAAYPGRVFAGVVTDIPGVLDPATRSAKVRVTLDNPGLALKPGMYGTAGLRSRRSETVLLVPQTAVVRTAEQSYVFLSLGGKRFRKVPVTAGSVQDGNMPVSGPLQAGDPVAANALDMDNATSGDGPGGND